MYPLDTGARRSRSFDTSALWRCDPAFNRNTKLALNAGIPFTTVFDSKGQPIDNAMRLSTLIGAFHDQSIYICADLSNAKLPIYRLGIGVPTASSRTY